MDARPAGLIPRLSGAAILALFALTPRPLPASSFRVTPVQIYFAPGSTSTLLTLENVSTESLRFQVTAHAWSQSAAGDIELGPTEDVMFFPALLALEPGKERKIRVGVAKPAEAVEKTYRVFVEELPPAAKPSEAGARSEVKVLTKMGIPIFVQPARIVRSGSIEGAKVEGGVLKFGVRNSGNVAFTLVSVQAAGRGTDGATTFDKQATGWYVLAGGVRDYELPIPPADCHRTKTLAVEAKTDRDSFRASLELTPGACGPASP